ncbi:MULTISPECIES: hypothetical protein [unclassified Pseudomonas]|uniref:hypothetical protein n=1 Tax=unclassified Pseudomonas TaxID=196821 RepID=UPI000C86A984|nr:MULTISPECIES: hypothetical protein [unclassified Pseudomonas]PMV89764.1 hypothetical protein C1X55_32955 [Pseudomonas sp. GW460-C8]PMW09449.1 hypothetical protein C1X40_33035 [Pseudomonas sp. GW456-11-11-14-TSB2]PMW11118.1 hypothetical protein C1X53_32445 [Pseudomonas sp. GW456-E6]PMW27452.1 hypothetical protein C1X45_33075 [Pseudomonas sp. GW460-7]PMW27553.1 hypothetical protein C1X48_33845 [Pseudomonas sp. FW305-3-2-15-A-R2A1]
MSKTVNQPWWSPIAHFAAHCFVGSIIFIIIGLPAVGLSFLVHYLESIGVSSVTIGVLTFLEVALTVTDGLLFLIYLALGIYRALKELANE